MNGVWLERDIGGTQYNRNTVRKVGNDRNVISKSTEKSIPHLWSVTLYKILKLHPSGVFDYLKHVCTNLSHCQKTWEDKPLLTLFCVGYYCIDLYFRRAQMKGIAIPCRIGYVYWIYRQPKGWKTAYCRARWYQNPSHYRLKEKPQYRKPRPTRLISEFAYFFNLHWD